MPDLTDKPLGKQLNSTSCWISVAHFVLQYLGETMPTVQAMIQLFQRIDKSSYSAMAGAGKPSTILAQWSYQTQLVPVPDGAKMKADILRNIAGSIAAGIPVICHLASPQAEFWGHAVAIVGISLADETIRFKDPMVGNETRQVTFEELFVAGFKYVGGAFRGAYDEGKDIWAYAKNLTFVVNAGVSRMMARPPNPFERLRRQDLRNRLQKWGQYWTSATTATEAMRDAWAAGFPFESIVAVVEELGIQRASVYHALNLRGG